MKTKTSKRFKIFKDARYCIVRLIGAISVVKFRRLLKDSEFEERLERVLIYKTK